MKKKYHRYDKIESLISQGMEIKGQIFSSGSIRVDGKVEGELDIKGDVVIGEKGKVKGGIKVENIVVAGSIEGNIQARGKFEITATGVVKGDVTSSIITIEEGAVLEGTTKMSRPSRENSESKELSLKKERESISAMF
ncbi:MAG: bactofilin family protein [Syntrophomonadaceae bacterium]|jgi:cytoskeletal protein CcmA (bactofilin family)